MPSNMDWCDHCEARMEMVPVYVDEHFGNILVCHKCGR